MLNTASILSAAKRQKRYSMGGFPQNCRNRSSVSPPGSSNIWPLPGNLMTYVLHLETDWKHWRMIGAGNTASASTINGAFVLHGETTVPTTSKSSTTTERNFL
jgi:hypothetical protein